MVGGERRGEHVEHRMIRHEYWGSLMTKDPDNLSRGAE